MGDLWLKAGTAILTVALVGLTLGAGLPAIFALGMRSLGLGRAVSPDGETYEGGATSLGRVLAVVFFGLALAAVVFGIVVIIWGKQIF